MVSSTMRRAWRRLSPVVAVGALVLALSGCMRVTMDLTVNSDDTVDGTVVLAVSDSLISLMGDEADSLWQDGGFEGEPGVTTEDYAADGYTGKKFTLAKSPLSEVGDQDMTITRVGDEFVVSGQLDLTEASTEDLDMPGMQGILDSFDVRVSLTFPGEVVASNGTVTDHTVTWTPRMGQENPIEARAKATAGSSGLLPWIFLAAVVAVLVVGAVVTVALVLRRRRARAADAPLGIVGETSPESSLDAPSPTGLSTGRGADEGSSTGEFASEEPLTAAPAPAPAPAPEEPLL